MKREMSRFVRLMRMKQRLLQIYQLLRSDGYILQKRQAFQRAARWKIVTLHLVIKSMFLAIKDIKYSLMMPMTHLFGVFLLYFQVHYMKYSSIYRVNPNSFYETIERTKSTYTGAVYKNKFDFFFINQKLIYLVVIKILIIAALFAVLKKKYRFSCYKKIASAAFLVLIKTVTTRRGLIITK